MPCPEGSPPSSDQDFDVFDKCLVTDVTDVSRHICSKHDRFPISNYVYDFIDVDLELILLWGNGELSRNLTVM